MKNATEAMEGQAGQGNRATAVERPKVDLLEVVEKVSAELSQIRQRQYALESKLSKYERIFERIFQEEAAERLNPQKGYGADCAEISPLEQLRHRLR